MSHNKDNDLTTIDNMIRNPLEEQRTLADVAKAIVQSDPSNKKVSIRIVEEKYDGGNKKQWAGCTDKGKTWQFTK